MRILPRGNQNRAPASLHKQRSFSSSIRNGGIQRRSRTVPIRWLIADERSGARLLDTIRRLPRGSGILMLYRAMPAGRRQRLIRQVRRLARSRGLIVVDEARGEAARVHDMREIASARLRGAPLILVSPMFATRSHPDWQPLPRMRAAALVRLAGVPTIALGGMDEKGFAAVSPLGFAGWAGIDAWLSGED